MFLIFLFFIIYYYVAKRVRLYFCVNIILIEINSGKVALQLQSYYEESAKLEGKCITLYYNVVTIQIVKLIFTLLNFSCRGGQISSNFWASGDTHRGGNWELIATPLLVVVCCDLLSCGVLTLNSSWFLSQKCFFRNPKSK